MRGRDVRNNSLTGRDIAEATLGTVPNADRVDGLNMAPLNVRLPAGSPTRTVLGFGGLILNASCKANGDLDLSATTAANNAMVHVASITQGATPHYDQDNDLDVGQSVNALPGGQTADNEVQATLTYAAPGTSVVSVRYMAQHGDNLLSSPNDCFVLGSADQSG